MDIHCRTMINCSGLSAVDLARRVQGSKPSSVPRAFFAKGNYFRYTGTSVGYRIASLVPIYRSIELSIYPIELVLPVLPIVPPICFVNIYRTKASMYQVSRPHLLIFFFYCRYRAELDSFSIFDIRYPISNTAGTVRTELNLYRR